MTELLERAVQAIRQMPAAEQDSIASAILSMAQLFEGEPVAVDPNELRDVKEALAEIDRGEIATPEELAAAWRSFER